MLLHLCTHTCSCGALKDEKKTPLERTWHILFCCFFPLLPSSSCVKQWIHCEASPFRISIHNATNWCFFFLFSKSTYLVSLIFFLSPFMWCVLSLPTTTATIPSNCCLLSINGRVSGYRSDTGVMEVEEPLAGVSNESLSNAVFLPSYLWPRGPGCSEGVAEADMAVTEQTLLPGSRTQGLGLGCSPGWALTFFGEDCFSPEVLEYARSLGQHSGSASLEVKTQVSDLMPNLTNSQSHKWQMKILGFPVALTLLHFSSRL